MSPSVTHLNNLVIQLTSEIEALKEGPDSLKEDAANALPKLYRSWAEVLKALAKVYEGKDPEQAGVILEQAEGWLREWEGVFVEGGESRSVKVKKGGEGENKGNVKGKWQEVETRREEEIEMMENELNDLKSKTGSKKSGGGKDLEEKTKK
ncbi:MAG: hypothetical protein Q9226_004589 [Calogaya cf. arnoldii]